MRGGTQSQLVTLLVVVLLVGFGLARRMRPQPVRPQRIAVTGVVIVLLLGLSLVSTGSHIVNPLGLILAPVFAALGVAVGYYLVRSMTFWTDPNSGTLWMRGGVLFAVILVATIALRFGVNIALTGSMSSYSGPSATHPASSNGVLNYLSADLLFLSLGLWASRAYFLVQRYRAHTAAQPADASRT